MSAPPCSNLVSGLWLLSAPNRVVLQPGSLRVHRVDQVAAVEDEGGAEALLAPGEAGLGGGGPLGADDRRGGTVAGFVHVLVVADVAGQFAELVGGAEGFGVGGRHGGNFLEH